MRHCAGRAGQYCGCIPKRLIEGQDVIGLAARKKSGNTHAARKASPFAAGCEAIIIVVLPQRFCFFLVFVASRSAAVCSINGVCVKKGILIVNTGLLSQDGEPLTALAPVPFDRERPVAAMNRCQFLANGRIVRQAVRRYCPDTRTNRWAKVSSYRRRVLADRRPS